MGNCVSLSALRAATVNRMPKTPFRLSGRAGRTGRKRQISQSNDNDSGSAAKATRLGSSAAELFELYEEAPQIGAGSANQQRVIAADGVTRLCADLQLDPVDIRLLLLAWACRAAEMCQFTMEEFCRGCQSLRPEAPTVQQLRSALDAKLLAMTRPAGEEAAAAAELAFKDLYKWTFDFGLERGQRTLLLPMAVDLWSLVFDARPAGQPTILKAWLAWLQAGASGVKGITRDTWNMFLTFADTCAQDLAAYDQNEAWPSLIDDFVEAETDRANQNLGY